PEFVPTAELELAEGRLALARKEAAGLSKPVLAGRLAAAETGFQTVLERTSLQPGVRLRAEQGLDQIEELRGGHGPPAPPPPPPPRSPPPSQPPGGPTIQPRSSWNASPALAQRLTPAGGGWSRITIHHSAKDSKDLGTLSNGNVAEAIHDIQKV